MNAGPAPAGAVGEAPQRELGARRWQQPTLEAFHLVTEALLWYVLFGVMATSAERTFLEDLRERLNALVSSELGVDRDAAQRALLVVADALDSVQVGPNYLLFVLAAVGGFLLVRGLTRVGIAGAFSGVVIVIASVLGLNALLHLSLGGDLLIWDSAGLARFIDEPGRYFSGSFDVEGFARNPELAPAHGSALTASAIGLVGCWMRFMYVGRSPVSINSVLRSFTLGFALMLAAVVFARLEGAGRITLAAIPYFVLGVLTMAAAQAARATFGVEGVRKTTPWVVSMAVTGVTLLVVGTLLGLLALLDARGLLTALGNVLGQILEVILLIILTPIFWIIEPILRFLLPEGIAGLFDNAAQIGPPGEVEMQPEADPLISVPGWFRPLMQLLGLGVLLVAFFLAARRLVRRHDDDGGDYEEVRERGDAEPAGLGALFRGLLRRRPRRDREAVWLRRHAVYRLFARSLYDSEERGLARLAGETPVEFASVATSAFEAPLFDRIAAEFDRARYGRHFPEDDELRPLADELLAWEVANPPTEETRNRIQGAGALDELDAFRLRLELARRAARSARGASEAERYIRY